MILPLGGLNLGLDFDGLEGGRASGRSRDRLFASVIAATVDGNAGVDGYHFVDGSRENAGHLVVCGQARRGRDRQA